ncbi:hypothetical protein PIB30_029992 [Stylosanthes scabra]|uniref:Uncharacterized protein n=1 Tax=Stylosanthes scabra TaxID=79078 RepID=A0ABU6Z941_9FABA|nr:hypothetical protein [Stylosanthes scabra]
MRILSIRNETEQILGIFVSWKTRVLNMDMLVIIVRVPLLVKSWIGCEFLGIRTHNNHICGRTFGSTVRFTPVVSEPELHGKREAITNIRHLITGNPSLPIKEIVQNSSLQQCGLQATTSEQYVTIEIHQDLIREYLAQNYTTYASLRINLTAPKWK